MAGHPITALRVGSQIQLSIAAFCETEPAFFIMHFVAISLGDRTPMEAQEPSDQS